MRTLALSLLLTSGLGVACGGPDSDGPGSDGPGGQEQRGINVDPDGIYRFGVGDEVWINASNGEAPYNTSDLWTNSLNETLTVSPSATLTGGETAESRTRDRLELLEVTFDLTVVIRPEAVPFLPGWWWYAYSYPSEPTTVRYEGAFVEAPRGFRAEVYLGRGDIGRTRAAAILQSLHFE
jgi:hypothetical protein